MQQVVLNIKNDEKAKFLLDFLRQLDFIEIKQVLKGKEKKKEVEDKQSLRDVLLNAPVLSDEELESIEHIGKNQQR